MMLFARTPYVAAKVKKWAADDREFVRRAAFALIAGYAVAAKKATISTKKAAMLSTGACAARKSATAEPCGRSERAGSAMTQPRRLLADDQAHEILQIGLVDAPFRLNDIRFQSPQFQLVGLSIYFQ